MQKSADKIHQAQNVLPYIPEAYIFSEIISAHRADFLQRAEEVRWSRVIGWHLLADWLAVTFFNFANMIILICSKGIR